MPAVAMEPFFRIPRSLVDSHAWESSSAAVQSIIVAVYRLAGYRSNEWVWEGKRYAVGPGQFITSLPSLVKRSGKGVTLKHARMAMQILESGGYIRSEATTTGRLITLLLDEPGGPTKGRQVGRERADPRADCTEPEMPAHPASPDDEESARADPRAEGGPNEGRRRAATREERNRQRIQDDQFDSFWTVYPRKIEKSAAYRSWIARIQEGYSPGQMVSAAEMYARECEGRETKYIKHPKTFLGVDKPFLDRIQETGNAEEAAAEETVIPGATRPMEGLTRFMQEVMK